MKTYKTIKRFREGKYLAEVEVELRDHDDLPYETLSLNDVRKLERVRKSLAAGDLHEVAKNARLFVVEPMETVTHSGANAA